MKPVQLICPLAKHFGFFNSNTGRACVLTIMRSQHGSAQVEEETGVSTTARADLRSPCVTKWKRPPFLKNFFIGKFDTNVLAFPEVLDKEQVEDLERYVKNIRTVFDEKVNSVQIDIDKKVPEEVFQALRDFGYFGRMVPKEYGGLGLTRTEYLRLNEVVSLNTSIGASLCAHEFLGLEAILLFGSESQKKKYLPDLASGKKIAAVAIYDSPSWSDFTGMQTQASFVTETNSYTLKGTKSWVTNAEIADVFVIFAKTPITESTGDTSDDNVSAFLLDRDTEGLFIQKCEDLVGLKGSHAAEVQLREVFVSEKDALGLPRNGDTMIRKLMASSRFGTGSLTFSALKCLYDSVTDYLINAERGGNSLSYYQLVRKRLSKVIQMIYAMESVAYFNAAIYDTTENPDFTLEDSAMKVFNSEGTLFCIRELLAALGAVGISNSHLDIQRFYRDASALMYFDHGNDITRLLIGLTGCQYAGNHHGDEVFKHLNPFSFPWDHAKFLWRNWQTKKERFSYNQDIAGHLHPSLVFQANQLEQCVQRLCLVTDTALMQHARAIVITQFTPVRLANLAINIYVRTAVLSRMSRSYCLGLTNTDEELYIAQNFCNDANTSFMKTFLEVAQNDVVTDERHLDIGQYIVDKKGYFLEHPLKHNIL